MPTTDTLLFMLRVVSAVLLAAILFALFWVMWRDYRSAAREAAAPRRSYGRLVVLNEGDEVNADASIDPLTHEVYPLLPLTSLGRSLTNEVRVDDSFASSEHALVALRGGRWWLEDRQSRNGTTLNGIPVTQPVVITHGDVIGIGNQRYRLELE